MLKYLLAKLKRLLVKLMSAFIPSSQGRKDFRHKFLLDIYEMPITNSYYYGKIYMPYYPNFEISSLMPEIYNKDGQKMETFFIRDRVAPHIPNSDSKYFQWDRFNIALDTHFYTHASMLETMGKPTHRYGYFYESETIIPLEYQIFKKHKGLEKDFDGVITYSEELLETLDNAIFFPSCATIFYGKEYFKGVKDDTTFDAELYLKKNKNVSMICSSKQGTDMQKIRHMIAHKALQTGKVDLYGGFQNGQRFDYKSRTLKDYRFQIVVENDIKPYYFTEKILDCFASMTVPVYLGATKIDKFFNPDGIIKISKESDLEEVLKQCTEEEYEQRQKAVIENYYKSLMYNNTNDLLYETVFLGKVLK